MVHAVTSVATFFIPVEIHCDEGSLTAKPSEFALGCVALSERPLEYDLELLNSNAHPIHIDRIDLRSRRSDSSQVEVRMGNETLPSFQFAVAMHLVFHREEEGEYRGSYVITTDQESPLLHTIVISFSYK